MTEGHALEKLVGFHGHMCTGLALGVRAANMALRALGAEGGTDLVVTVETDTCSVDAIQVLTGCTFGNGRLYYRDHAKNAYTFGAGAGGRSASALSPRASAPTHQASGMSSPASRGGRRRRRSARSSSLSNRA